MPRSRALVGHLVVVIASALGAVAFGRPTQTPVQTQPPKPRPKETATALQPPVIRPTGRVCAVKSFGAPTAAGRVEPILFNFVGAIATGPGGNLFSTSPSGGNYGAGTIFQVSPIGQVKVLHSFIKNNRDEGAGPQSGLVDGHDGYFYGTTYGGGHVGTGTLFRIRADQTKPEILWHFRNGSTLKLLADPCGKPICPYSQRQRADIAAAYPVSPPVVAPGGVIYGVTSYSNNQNFGVLYRTAPPYDSTSFHALCIFDQRMLADTAMAPFVCKAKGFFPNALLLAPDGMLYGTTLGGYGSVFRASTGGETTTIHEFDLDHGAKPFNLMLASDGRLYGTTMSGGDTGHGVVYSLETSGDGLMGGGFTVMSSFRVGSWLQGFDPVGGLVEVKPPGSVQSFLFGTTKFGGRYGRGTLFRIPLDGDSLHLRVLHDFDMYNTGRSPVTAPVLGPRGLLYGLTYEGGAFGNGQLYTLDPIVLNDQFSHDAVFNGGVRAAEDRTAPIVRVDTNVTASQSGADPTGKVVTTTVDRGIMVRGFCPNPHIVQFTYRELISAQGVAQPGTSVSRGPPLPWTDEITEEKYPFTTDLRDIHWHSDAPKFEMGFFKQRNAYLDQADGAAHASGLNMVTIFDRPSFGSFDDPTKAAGPYLPAAQTADPTKSEIWRLTARDFLICNCQVAKEIWWARQVRGGKASYTAIRIRTPATDALNWINAQLKRDGYAPIP
jgi:uncharacterized repeat protein (TIGR03803 family)